MKRYCIWPQPLLSSEKSVLFTDKFLFGHIRLSVNGSRPAEALANGVLAKVDLQSVTFDRYASLFYIGVHHHQYPLVEID